MTRRTDIYATSVVLWELLVGEPLFRASNEAALMARIVEGAIPPPSRKNPELSPALDAVVLRGLARDPERRFATARELALALEGALPPATAHATGAWVERIALDHLAARRQQLALVEGNVRVEAALPHIEPGTSVDTLTAPRAPIEATEVIDGPTQLVSSSTPDAEVSSRPSWVVAGAVVVLGGLALALSQLVPPDLSRASSAELGRLAGEMARALPVSEESAADELPVVADASASETEVPVPPPSASAAVAKPAPAPWRAPARPKPAAPKPTSAPSCDPPYTVDGQGHRHAKRECL